MERKMTKEDIINRVYNIQRMLSGPVAPEVIEKDKEVIVRGIPGSKRNDVVLQILQLVKLSQQARVEELNIEIKELEGLLKTML